MPLGMKQRDALGGRADLEPRARLEIAKRRGVAGHLGVAADEYDRTIRTFVPSYERMLATIVHWLDGHVPSGGLVVDLVTK